MTAHTNLRILRLEDFPAVKEIFQNTFPKTYEREFQLSWISRATAFSFGAFEGKSLVGFVISSYQAELENSYHIHFLGIHPSVQKGGFGTTLLHNVIQAASEKKKSVSLIPLENERLIRWYEKQGFSFTGKVISSPYTGEQERFMIRNFL
jgi:ribosomal protein S18 acetylase RimI-like enzyme